MFSGLSLAFIIVSNSIMALLVIQAKTYVFLFDSVGKWFVFVISLFLNKICYWTRDRSFLSFN
jgi:hypothetical protein